MKILVVTQYFWPEQFRINDLVKGLIERGNEVTVLTGCPNYPNGKIFNGYGIFNRPETHEGAKVIRVPMLPRGNGSGLRLGFNYLSFALSASLLGPILCRGDYDAIFVFQASPVTVGIPAIVMKWFKQAPILFWIVDLWPDSLAATGAIKSDRILRGTDHLIKWIYSHCKKIMYSSKGFLESLSEKSPRYASLAYFPNWIEPEMGSNEELPISLPDGFKIIFAGNIGVSQDFETILTAAERVADLRDIKWIILGDGRMAPWVKEEVTKRNLSNCFHLLGQFPSTTMPAFFSAADALLVTLLPEPVFALTVPGKVQSYLACGRPIIAALNGEGAALIHESTGGLAVAAGDVEGLANAVRKVHAFSREKRDEMGRNGKIYANDHFDRELLFDRLDGWIQEAVSSNSKTRNK
ncbi:glycosyltransferase family 4 protein [Geothrix sp. SG200]|uniref:glycosyltransferase family 4 protein n=1 Tax=Geothrix sp. SG200 TaxID=2922865 RepID=UPI001FAB5689|nr:glycosyltransferase family 4 protein [Geothrix sp. SG200]